MTDMQQSTASRQFPQVRTGPLILGGALVGAGALIAIAGWAVGLGHVTLAIRQWIQEMETPPSELAKARWAQARRAAAAGTQAWQNGNGVSARESAGI